MTNLSARLDGLSRSERGPLSIPVLTGALQRLVARHEVFRTFFVAGDEGPLQAVLPEVRLVRSRVVRPRGAR